MTTKRRIATARKLNAHHMHARGQIMAVKGRGTRYNCTHNCYPQKQHIYNGLNNDCAWQALKQ